MKKLAVVAAGLFTPFLASAQVTDFNSLISFASKVLDAAIPFIISLSIVVLMYGIFRYVVANEEEAKAKGKNLIISGIVGLFVMLSIWGLVRILVNTFRLDNQVPTSQIPTVITPKKI
jgi:hypothetical protein